MRFFYCTPEIRIIWNKHNVYFSEKFCNYFSDKIKEIFEREAGIKPSYKIGLSITKPFNVDKMYEVGEVSRINTALTILPEYDGNISFCWKSRSGKIIKTTDEDFDETDLECWIEGLKPKEYWDYIGGEKDDHPFKIKNLPFELKVYEFGVHMGISILTTDNKTHQAIKNKLADVIEEYNNKSEKSNGSLGFVHNSSATSENNMLLFRIDVGSAGVLIIKKLLKTLGKFEEVKKVVLDL